MLETMDKLLLAGLGALSMTRKHAEKIFQDCARRGEALKTTRPGFVKDLVDSAQKTRKDLEELVARQVHQAVTKLELVSRQDLARVEKKLDQLLKRKP